MLSHIAINFSNKWVIFGPLTSNQNQLKCLEKKKISVDFFFDKISVD